MAKIVLHTFDWVPEKPRGYVRDLRIRWALEEAELPYTVQAEQFDERGANHYLHQPFGQVPWLTDGNLSVFETGAILLHLAEKSSALLPTDPNARSAGIQWVFAALNSFETAVVPLVIYWFAEDTTRSPGLKGLERYLHGRLTHLETVLAKREWLAGTFSIADILMVDALRLVHRMDRLKRFPACQAYMERGTARPAFQKVHADQMAHFVAGDAARAKAAGSPA